ncbi:MAG: hypothetical protein ACKODX_16790 [Gemmata sp.]
MTPTASLDHYPAGRRLTADQITEFHAARLLLLIYFCGTKVKATGRLKIEGLTRLAKLDFFVRYPDFFRRAKDHLGQHGGSGPTAPAESAMVRHHYGPWDARYYQVLGFLESRELIAVERQDKTFVFILTEAGQGVAKRLAEEPSYSDLCSRMREVRDVFKGKTGDWLKKLVYKLFDAEVASLPLGQVIEP